MVPDHEGGGYGIAEALIIEAVRIKKNRPLKLLALAGEVDTPASNDRMRGLQRAIALMRKLLGPDSVELIAVAHLDWSEKSVNTWVRGFAQKGLRIDALWAANDPMASRCDHCPARGRLQARCRRVQGGAYHFLWDLPSLPCSRSRKPGVGILAVTLFGASFHQIADRNLPALIASSQLSELSRTVVAIAPEIALGDTQISRQAMADQL